MGSRDGAVVQTWVLRRPVPDLSGGARGARAALSGGGVHKAQAPVFKEKIGSEPRQGAALHHEEPSECKDHPGRGHMWMVWTPTSSGFPRGPRGGSNSTRYTRGLFLPKV